MSCETITMSTPQKPIVGGVDEMFLIEDIEKKLESFSHLLEKSTDKEKGHLKRINEQESTILSLQSKNEELVQENEKLRLTVQNHMQNFVCFMQEMKLMTSLEEENRNLKQKLDQCINETSDKIVDLELEKDRLSKENKNLTQENKKLKEEIKEMKTSLDQLNNLVLDSLKKTLAYSREEKIKKLEKEVLVKDFEISELKSEVEKKKEHYEKLLKQKALEYDLLKMDYQSAIVQNLQSRQTSYKGDKGKSEKAERSDKSEREVNNEKNGSSAKQTSARPFKIITTNADSIPSKTTRRTRNAYNKNTAVRNVKDEIENDLNDDNFINDNDEEFEIDLGNNEEDSFDEEDEEEEKYVPKKGKRKAKENKKKPATKRVKKNENKELLLVNRNTIQYHLFN